MDGPATGVEIGSMAGVDGGEVGVDGAAAMSWGVDSSDLPSSESTAILRCFPRGDVGSASGVGAFAIDDGMAAEDEATIFMLSTSSSESGRGSTPSSSSGAKSHGEPFTNSDRFSPALARLGVGGSTGGGGDGVGASARSRDVDSEDPSSSEMELHDGGGPHQVGDQLPVSS